MGPTSVRLSQLFAGLGGREGSWRKRPGIPLLCMRCLPCGRRPAASGRRGPLRLRSKAPIGRLHCAFALAARFARCLPIGRHRCALRSRRRAPANGSGDIAVAPDARLRPRVGAAALERSPIGRVLTGRASAASAIPSASLRVCQDRLCTYKVTWAMPPYGGVAGRAVGFAIVREVSIKNTRALPCVLYRHL